MAASLVAWAEEGHLRRLLDTLFDEGYSVALTSDHGYVEVKTVGVSREGVIVDPHGRFEVFNDPLLLRRSLERDKPVGRFAWSNYGLPPGYLVVFAPLFGALKPIGDRLLSHGGPTLEEVIVPWVTITR